MKHRPGIQDLTAIAVLYVVLSHFEIHFFSGGLNGVDIFFAISGFLIIGGIIECLDARTPNLFSIFRLHEIYFRPARRIPPVALIIQIIVHEYDFLFSDVLAFQSTLQDLQNWETAL